MVVQANGYWPVWTEAVLVRGGWPAAGCCMCPGLGRRYPAARAWGDRRRAEGIRLKAWGSRNEGQFAGLRGRCQGSNAALYSAQRHVQIAHHRWDPLQTTATHTPTLLSFPSTMFAFIRRTCHLLRPLLVPACYYATVPPQLHRYTLFSSLSRPHPNSPRSPPRLALLQWLSWDASVAKSTSPLTSISWKRCTAGSHSTARMQ